MVSDHSWKWLPPRPSVHSMPTPPNPRPCLPVLEQLDDRVMLSAAANDVGTVDNGGTNQVLIALLRGQVPLVADELAALKIAGSLSTDHKFFGDSHKFSDAFVKLEDVIYKLGDVLIKAEGKVMPSDIPITIRIDKASAAISEALLKITEMANTIGGANRGDSLLLPAVNKLQTDTMAFVDEFLKLAPQPGTISQDMSLNFLKISDEFLKLDQDVIKIGGGTGLSEDKHKGELEFLKVIMDQILVSSAKIGDPTLHKVLLGLETDTVGLLQPGNPTGGTGVTG